MAKIHVVDDTKFLRSMLTSILIKDGHEVIGEAENGMQAIEQYKKLRPDLVTMDITMPVMNGLEAISEIKKVNPQANIIVCSAVGQQKVVVLAIEAGAKDFIIKPFNEAKVLDIVKQVLESTG